MPTPPVMPTVPSMTSSLRWSRGMKPNQARSPGGLNTRTSTPALRRLPTKLERMPRMPIQSVSRRTETPRDTASASAVAKRWPVSSERRM
jgi:hypothetical protein